MGYNVAAELFAEWAVGLGIIALRLYARWKVGKGRFYWDDLFLGFAVVRLPSIPHLSFGVADSYNQIFWTMHTVFLYLCTGMSPDPALTMNKTTRLTIYSPRCLWLQHRPDAKNRHGSPGRPSRSPAPWLNPRFHCLVILHLPSLVVQGCASSSVQPIDVRYLAFDMGAYTYTWIFANGVEWDFGSIA